MKPAPMAKIVAFLDEHPDVIAATLCKLCDIPVQRLYNFRNESRKRKLSRASEPSEFGVVPVIGGATYSASDKLSLVKRFEKLEGEGRVALLRQYGIYQSDIGRWQESIDQAAVESLGRRKTRSDKQSVESKTIEGLKKELLNREKRIEKLETLVMIQKKLSALLGENESA